VQQPFGCVRPTGQENGGCEPAPAKADLRTMSLAGVQLTKVASVLWWMPSVR
jgi:hypothetical protein